MTLTEADLNTITWNLDGYDNEIFGDNLLVMYNFDNSSELGEDDSKVVDVSKNGIDSTSVNAIMASDGKFDGGVWFDGNATNTNITSTLSSYPYNSIENMTISFWFKPDVQNDSDSWTGLFGLSTAYKHSILGCGYGGYVGGYGVSANKTACWMMAGSSTSGGSRDSVTSLGLTNDLNTWYHVVLTIDDDYMKLYIDGVLNDEDARDYHPYINKDFTLGHSKNNYGIGHFTGTIDQFMWFNETYDDIKSKNLYYNGLKKVNSTDWIVQMNLEDLEARNHIYYLFANDTSGNEVLSSQRSFTIYPEATFRFTKPTPKKYLDTDFKDFDFSIDINASGINDFKWHWNGTNHTIYDDSLILFFNFNNQSFLGEDYTTVVDISNNRTGNLTVMNQSEIPFIIESGKYGKSINFHSDSGISGNMVELSSPVGLNSTNMTISAWMKYYSLTGLQNIGGQISNKYVTTSTRRGSFLFGINSGGKAQTRYYPSASSSTNYYVESSALSVNTWYHIVFTDLNGNGSLYVNGNLVDTDSNMNATNIWNKDIQWIGMARAQAYSFFNGTIDQVMIWNRSLSSAEVEQLYYSNLDEYDSDSWSFQYNRTNLLEGNYNYTAYMTDSFDDNVSIPIRRLTISTNPTLKQSSRSSGIAFNREISMLPRTTSKATMSGKTFKWYVNNSLYKQGSFLYYDEFNSTLNSTFWVLNGSDQFRTVNIDNSYVLYKNSTAQSKLNLSVTLPENYVMQFKIKLGSYVSGFENITIYTDYLSSTNYKKIRIDLIGENIQFFINDTLINNDQNQIQPIIARIYSGSSQYMWTWDNGYEGDGWTWFRLQKLNNLYTLDLSRDGSRFYPIISYINETSSGGTVMFDFDKVETWMDDFLISTDLNYTLNDEVSAGDSVRFEIDGKNSSTITLQNPILVERFDSVDDMSSRFELVPYEDYEYSNYTIKLVDVVSDLPYTVTIYSGDYSGYELVYSSSVTGSNVTIPLFDMSEDETGGVQQSIYDVVISPSNVSYSAIEFYREETPLDYTENQYYSNWLRSEYKFLKNGYLNRTDDGGTEGYMDMNPQMNHHLSRGFVSKNEISYYYFMKKLNSTFGDSGDKNLDDEISRQENRIQTAGYNFTNNCTITSVGSDPEYLGRAYDLYLLEGNTSSTAGTCWHNAIVTASDVIFRTNYNSTNGVFHQDLDGASLYIDWHQSMKIGLLFEGYLITGNTTWLDAVEHGIDSMMLNGLYNDTSGIFMNSVMFNGTSGEYFITSSPLYSSSATLSTSRELLRYYEATGNETYLAVANNTYKNFFSSGYFNMTFGGQPGEWLRRSNGDSRQYFDYSSSIFYSLYQYRKITGLTDLYQYEKEAYYFLVSNNTFVNDEYLNIGGGQYGEMIEAEDWQSWVIASSMNSRSANDYSRNGNYQSAESSKGVYYLLQVIDNMTYWNMNSNLKTVMLNDSDAGDNYINVYSAPFDFWNITEGNITVFDDGSNQLTNFSYSHFNLTNGLCYSSIWDDSSNSIDTSVPLVNTFDYNITQSVEWYMGESTCTVSKQTISIPRLVTNGRLILSSGSKLVIG